MRDLIQSVPATASVFFASAGEHITGVVGITSFNASSSKNGAAFYYPTMSASAEIGRGWYNFTLSAGMVDTLNDLVFSISAASADPVDLKFNVVYSKVAASAATWGNLDATVSSRFAGTAVASANLMQISGASAAAANFLAQYNGSGYINDNGPAYQSQIAAIAGGLSVKNTVTSSTVISGSAVGAISLMNTDDGNRYVVTAAAGTGALEFILLIRPDDTTAQPVELHMHGFYDEAVGATNSLLVQVYNFNTAGWETLQTLTNAAANLFFDVSLHAGNNASTASTVETVDVVTGDVLIKFKQVTGEENSTMNIDHLVVGFAGSPLTAAEVWAAATRSLTNVVSAVHATATQVTDKTGYTASTVSDKTGYSLAAAYDLAKTAAQATAVDLIVVKTDVTTSSRFAATATEVGRLDVAVSSRFAATAAELAKIDVNVSSRFAGTATEVGRIDAAISTRGASAVLTQVSASAVDIWDFSRGNKNMDITGNGFTAFKSDGTTILWSYAMSGANPASAVPAYIKSTRN